jgi:hypothetical protein
LSITQGLERNAAAARTAWLSGTCGLPHRRSAARNGGRLHGAIASPIVDPSRVGSHKATWSPVGRFPPERCLERGRLSALCRSF